MGKLDGRSESLTAMRMSTMDKDMRRRSLNFHKFTTVFPTPTNDVAVDLRRSVEQENLLRRLRLRDILKLVEVPETPPSSVAETLRAKPVIALETLENHFREIPPHYYPKLLRLLVPVYHSKQLGTRGEEILDKFLSAFLDHLNGTNFESDDIGTILGLCRAREIPGTLRAVKTQLVPLCWSPITLLPLAKYLSNVNPAGLHPYEYRLLRALIHHATDYMSRPTMIPSFSNRIGLVPTVPDIAQLTHQDFVFVITLLGHFSKSSVKIRQNFYEALRSRIPPDPHLSDLEKMQLLVPFARDRNTALMCRNLIYHYVKSKRNFSSLSIENSQELYGFSREVGFHHPFHLERLKKKIGLISLPVRRDTSCLQPHQLSPDEAFLEIYRLVKISHLNRRDRRRLHFLMESINIGRVSANLIRSAKSDSFGNNRLFLSFLEKLDLARKFHE